MLNACMDIDWDVVFPGVSQQSLSAGATHFHETIRSLPAREWRKEGTLLCTGSGRSRVGFAIRKKHCSWHFRNRDAIAFYQAIGGACRSTEVTITFGHDDMPDHAVIGKVVAMVLSRK